MTKEKPEWIDPDDAPELTDEFFEKSEVWHGDKLIKKPDSNNFKDKARFR